MSDEQGRFDWSQHDPTAAFHGGDPFSVAAHERIRESKEVIREAIFRLIAQASEGMTCDEVEVATGRSHQTVSARITELKQQGRLTSGGRRPTRTGSSAAVHVAVR
jgi:predicted transcriptional regulator